MLLAYTSSSSDSENEPDPSYSAPVRHIAENVSGLFPTFVFFPVLIDASLRITIDDALDAISSFAAAASPLEDLHVTVSGTLMLRRDQCDGFLRILGRRLREIPISDASLCSVVMLPSHDAASTFAAFPLQVASSFFRNVCSAVDATCAALSLPSQSLSPMPHLSFARIPLSMPDAPAIKLPRGSKIPLRCLDVSIGKLKHTLPLSGIL